MSTRVESDHRSKIIKYVTADSRYFLIRKARLGLGLRDVYHEFMITIETRELQTPAREFVFERKSRPCYRLRYQRRVSQLPFICSPPSSIQVKIHDFVLLSSPRLHICCLFCPLNTRCAPSPSNTLFLRFVSFSFYAASSTPVLLILFIPPPSHGAILVDD